MTKSIAQSDSLIEHFIIAMPSILEEEFYRAVTLICEHNEQGVMGFIINHPTDLTVSYILKQMDIKNNNPTLDQTIVLNGGPIQQDKGFVIHEPNPQGKMWESTLRINENIELTTSRDILVALAKDEGPKHFIICLGYAGWSAGQLEQEIASNMWLNTQANTEILFNTPIQERWHMAVSAIGFDITDLSNDVGHA